MAKFLSNFSSSDDSENEVDLVLFSDSDAVFNFNAVSAMDVVERFDHIVENAQEESPGRKITVDNSVVITAESACWIGHKNCEEVLPRYPIVAPGKSNCPQFLNSGGYLGSASTLYEMIQYMLNLTQLENGIGRMSSDQALMTTFYLNHHHYTPPPAQVAFRKATKESHIDDTTAVAILDRHASIFRSLTIGYFAVDNSTTGEETCGTQEGIKNCGA
eukprot:CAMPEP_0113499066 /NCGR_PEP_ID=MMETSP0014_2-20120614/31539_1 /TAXON_ID=2857 /ORGANISM="Nitzschia sp." /LENGTH=216 /DNA_ID=CAMNT_0000393195 /DNA_START=301 /DNA_END=948 /DNA_ORIENTATION=- /assembly_acc=CAM_ASM_000159